MATETKLQIIILERISTFQYGLLLNFLVWENLVILFPASTKTVGIAISKKLGIRPTDDTDAMMPQRLIYTIKDLRNAIAHNDVVFDTRFQTGEINKQVGHAISNVTGINHLTFRTITDYLILVIYQLKLLHVSKSEMKRIISRFEYIVEKLRSNIPINIFHQIIYTDNRSKIILLKKFVSK